MRPEQGFAGKTRVQKVKGHGKGRRGLVTEVDLMASTWLVCMDDTKLTERSNPYEFEPEPKDGEHRY